MTRLIKGFPASHFIEAVNGNDTAIVFTPFKIRYLAFSLHLTNEMSAFHRTIAIGYCREKTEEERAAFRRRYS